jgi:hypothetical protein
MEMKDYELDHGNSSEIHISGRIDNFLFGKIKKSYFDELEKSGEVFKDNKKDNQLFLEKFFSLFLENDPFSDKTNLELFEELIDNKKFLHHCPNFYKIYLTILPDTHENYEELSSFEYDHYSFLKEVLDSPSHLSQNIYPEVDNQFRVFSNELLLEIFSDDKKIEESTLGEFLNLKEAELDDNFNFKYSDKQKKAFDNLIKNKLSYWDVDPTATTKYNSIRYDGFWPKDFFRFVLGNSSDLYDKSKNFFAVANDNFQYDRSSEVRIIFSNVSKCVFKIKEKIDFEKLSFLRCGLDELCRSSVINYDDKTNLFNFLAYNGEIIKPNETIHTDKGILIDLMKNNETRQPSFYELFIS